MSEGQATTYGATDNEQQDVVLTVTTGEGEVSIPVTGTEEEISSIRQRMEIGITFAILRKKYLMHMLFYSYFAALTVQTPIGVYLFLSDERFVSFVLRNTHVLHNIIQTVNLVIFYALVISGFNLDMLFASFQVGKVFGNLLIATFSGMLFALESLDEVAVFYKLGWIDESSVFHANAPSDVGKQLPDNGGLSPDSPLFLCVYIVALFCIFMVVVNFLHFLYYQNVYYKLLSGNMEAFRDEDGDVHV